MYRYLLKGLNCELNSDGLCVNGEIVVGEVDVKECDIRAYVRDRIQELLECDQARVESIMRMCQATADKTGVSLEVLYGRCGDQVAFVTVLIG